MCVFTQWLDSTTKYCVYSQGLDSTTKYCVCTHTRTWQQNHVLCVYSHNDLIAQPCIVCTHSLDSTTMYCVCIHSRTWQQNHALCVYSHKDLTAQPCVVHMFTRQHRLEFQWRTPLTVYHVLYVYAPKRTRMAAVPCIMCIQTKPLPHSHALCVFNQGHYHIARYYVYSTKDMTTKPCIMCTQPRTRPHSHGLCVFNQRHDHIGMYSHTWLCISTESELHQLSYSTYAVSWFVHCYFTIVFISYLFIVL